MRQEKLAEVEQEAENTGPGQRLKQARTAKGLSLEDIAKHLKSNVRTIEALENEDSEHLPQAIYVSGYLRSYAGLVGLPAEDMIRDYPNLGTADPVIPSFKKQASPVKLGKRKIGKMGNVGKKSRPYVKLALLVIVLAGVGGLGAWFFFKGDKVKTLVSNVVKEDRQATKQSLEIPVAEHSAVVTPEEQPLPEPVQQEQPAEAVEEIKMSRLLLEFSDDSWVEVKDARGERLVYRLAKAPSRRFVEGVAPFSIFLGYAPGVSINYNGLPYDLNKYRDGDVAQFTIGKLEDNQ